MSECILAPLGLSTEPGLTELALTVSGEARGRVVSHDASALMRRAGLDLSELLTSPAETPPPPPQPSEHLAPPSADIEAPSSSQSPPLPTAGAAQGSASPFASARHQLGPCFLNMQRLRAAELPGVSMHGSARALAAFYNAVGSAQLLPADLVADLVAVGASAWDRQGGVTWAAGFQCGQCVGVSGRRFTVLGHGAPGGTLGLCGMRCADDQTPRAPLWSSPVLLSTRQSPAHLRVGCACQPRPPPETCAPTIGRPLPLLAVLIHPQAPARAEPPAVRAATQNVQRVLMGASPLLDRAPVPECGVSLAVTVSKLTPTRTATRKLVDTVLSEFGLRLVGSAPGLLQDGH